MALPGEEPRPVNPDGDAGGGGHGPICQAEIPAVVGANGAPILNIAGGKIVPGVWADVVQDVCLALVQENGQRIAVDFHQLARPLG